MNFYIITDKIHHKFKFRKPAAVSSYREKSDGIRLMKAGRTGKHSEGKILLSKALNEAKFYLKIDFSSPPKFNLPQSNH